MMSKYGGGTSCYLGNIRPRGAVISTGGLADGPVHYARIYDTVVDVCKQSEARRGACAAYLPLEHPDISEFLDIGTEGNPIQNLQYGITVSDAWLRSMKAGSKEKRKIWAKVIQRRSEFGYPYIMFKDTVQDALPKYQKEAGLKVNHSNLCSEITLATDEDRTAVCCLSSVNLEEFDEWKHDDNFIPDLIRMLDNVISYFIENAPMHLVRAVYSASRERSLGLGAMGFHAYLQRHNLPFESASAKGANMKMFQHIKWRAKDATKKLAEERGECPDGVGYGVRNAHLLAVAPNASSSIICGNTSPSIEPYRANAFTQKTKSGSSLLKNEYLEHILQELDQDTDDVWKSIITNNGSVQHLDFLDEWSKDVFKTAVEIDQKWIIDMASDRQMDICQSQSLNIFFPADVSKQELHAIHMMAWKRKVKTLYYLRSEAIKRAETVSDEVLRQYIFDSLDDEGCVACEG